MMNEYPKIQSLFFRDTNKAIIPDMFTLPEFGFLKDSKWECTEKIDGTNIRIVININIQHDADGNPEVFYSPKLMGRTDKAIIPERLIKRLCDIIDKRDEDGNCLLYDAIQPVVDSAIKRHDFFTQVTLYGEGYGQKIQKGGGYIANGVDFILFDVKTDNTWLKRESCEEIAKTMGIKIVPIIGYMTIDEAVDYVKNGFKSTISEDKDFWAEGLVLKNPLGLRDRKGNRIITKLKTHDFTYYKALYGDKKVEQVKNPNYDKNNK